MNYDADDDDYDDTRNFNYDESNLIVLSNGNVSVFRAARIVFVLKFKHRPI